MASIDTLGKATYAHTHTHKRPDCGAFPPACLADRTSYAFWRRTVQTMSAASDTLPANALSQNCALAWGSTSGGRGARATPTHNGIVQCHADHERPVKGPDVGRI